MNGAVMDGYIIETWEEETIIEGETQFFGKRPRKQFVVKVIHVRTKIVTVSVLAKAGAHPKRDLLCVGKPCRVRGSVFGWLVVCGELTKAAGSLRRVTVTLCDKPL